LKVIALIIGIAVAAWGGVILFRALFLDPSGTAVINESTGAIRQYPNLSHVIIGTVMLIGGACTAFFASRRKPM
jgi:hypothetical protein